MNQRSTQKKLLAPELDEEKIISCYNEFNIKLSTKDLKEPDSNISIYFYNCFSELFTGVGIGHYLDLMKKDEEDLELIEFGEVMAYRLFQHHLSKVLFLLGMHEMGLNELLEPTPEVFKDRLSCIINFIKYREYYIGALEEKAEKMNGIKLEILNKKREIAELRLINNTQRITKIEIKRNRRVKKLVEMEIEEAKTLAKEQTAQFKVFETLLNLRNDRRDRLLNLEDAIKKGHINLHLLNSMIIDNPTEFRNRIIHLNDQLKLMILNYSEVEKRVTNLKSQNAIKEQIILDIKYGLNILTSVKKTYDQYLNTNNHVKFYHEDTRQAIKLLNDTINEIKIMQNKLSSLINEQRQVSQERKEKIQLLKREKRKLEQQIEVLKKKKEDKDQELHSRQTHLDIIKKDANNLIKETDVQFWKLKETLNQLNNRINRYFNNLEKKTDLIF